MKYPLRFFICLEMATHIEGNLSHWTKALYLQQHQSLFLMTLLEQGAKCVDGNMNTMNDDNDDEIVVATTRK
jgi:hypothetical protein